MLSPALQDFLIELGKADPVTGDCNNESARQLIGDGSFMRREPKAWEDLARPLSEQQIEWLIKGVTLAERDFDYCFAGSVSPAIWLTRVLAARRNDDIGELVDWVRAHTRNDYLPFGIRRDFGARSLAELAAGQAAHVKQRKIDKAAEDERRQIDRANKALFSARRAKDRASWNLIRAIERHDLDAIARWLREGADANFANDEGVTAREMARERGLEYLFGAGTAHEK